MDNYNGKQIPQGWCLSHHIVDVVFLKSVTFLVQIEIPDDFISADPVIRRFPPLESTGKSHK